ncbi:MAG: TIGR04255 family protein [Thermosynechococcaceae cyanobacterium]
MVEADTTTLPIYEKPPITEVACSILFPQIVNMRSPHIGLLWQRFQAEYPICEDVAPITSRLEVFGSQKGEAKLELSNLPPLPRVWFISEDNTRLVQVQRDRFIYNWRKANSDSKYPRYSYLIQSFQSHLEEFDSFLRDANLEPVQPIQYELTYVNQIPQGESWSTFEDIGKFFPDIHWKTSSSRFLEKPQSISWSTVFELPDKVGRLYASVKPGHSDEKLVISFELTVRGIGNYKSKDQLQDWFDIAHESIVCSFADLTHEEVQVKVWQRRS